MIIFKAMRLLIKLILSCLFLPVWWLCGLFPRNKKLWIFSAWFGQKYSDNSRAMFEYVLKNHPEINCVWITKDKTLVAKLIAQNKNAVYSKSLKCMLLTLRASTLFTTTGGEFFYGFCNGIKHYALWHGMPLKKILYDDSFSGQIKKSKIGRVINDISVALNKNLFQWRSFHYLPNTYTITNSSFFRPFLKSAFLFDDSKILNTGSPRLDVLFNSRAEPFLENIRKKFPDSKIILYMPTFRTGAWTKEPFDPFNEKYGFDAEKFELTLENQRNVVLYKPHFYDATLLHHRNGNSRFLMISDNDFDELYNFVAQVDVLITDYSSIYFDFIVTRKPVILAPFDLEEYLQTARGHYFDYNTEIEGVKAHNWNELLEILENENYAPVSDEKIKQFAEFVDGKSAEKIFKLGVKK